MNSEFKTPPKSHENSISQTPDTVKHLKNVSIFSASSGKLHASPISENRYRSSGNLLEKTLENDSESGKIIVLDDEEVKEKNLIGTVKISPKEKSRGKKSHLRNVSDADSVVYIGSDEKRFYGTNSQSFVLGEKPRQSLGILEDIKNKEVLVVLENAPCMAYCRYCKVDVHTEIEFYTSRVPKKMMKAFASIFSCCSIGWIDGYRVHKCPNCSLVIAKCR